MRTAGVEYINQLVAILHVILDWRLIASGYMLNVLARDVLKN